MRTPGVKLRCLRGSGDLLLLLVTLAAGALGPGGCSVLISEELSDKADETEGAGGLEDQASDGRGGGDAQRQQRRSI